MNSLSATLTACFFFCLYLIFHYASVKAGGRLGEVLGKSIGKVIGAFIRVAIPRARKKTVHEVVLIAEDQGQPALENRDLIKRQVRVR